MMDAEKKPTVMSRALVVLATVATIYFLKWAGSILIPLVFALFLIAVFWPLYRRLTHAFPPALATITCGLLALALGLGFGWALFLSADYVAEQDQISEYQEKFGQIRSRIAETGERIGLPQGEFSDISLKEALNEVLQPVQAFLFGGTLTLAFLILGLVEVRDYGKRLRHGAPDDYVTVIDVLERVATNFQRYVVVRTGIGLLTGALVTVAALLIGLDLALIWGFINFLLNYIPTLGSILGVVPPTLFALLQFDDLSMVLLTFAIVGAIQLLMGNYIDPLAQGKYLSLSPVVILFAVTFWGFIWGIAGALLAVPLTLLLALVLREFPSSRFLSSLLLSAEYDGEGRRQSAK